MEGEISSCTSISRARFVPGYSRPAQEGTLE